MKKEMKNMHQIRLLFTIKSILITNPFLLVTTKEEKIQYVYVCVCVHNEIEMPTSHLKTMYANPKFL